MNLSHRSRNVPSPPAAGRTPSASCLGGRSLILRSLRPAASGSANIIHVEQNRFAVAFPIHIPPPTFSFQPNYTINHRGKNITLGDFTMNTFLHTMKEYLELRRLSKNTQESYLRIVRQFAEFFNTSVEHLGEREIKDYLLHLSRTDCASSTLRVNRAALKFLYEVVLAKPWEIEKIPHVKCPQRLPIVLSREEINALLNAAINLKHKALLAIGYSAGLRTSEIAQLKVTDIDSSRMQIRIENAKGAKDRYSILSKTALQILRRYWKAYRSLILDFPRPHFKDIPISYRAISFVFNQYKEKAGITKPATVHSLRHSFATHLLENGVNLHHIQLLLGHKSLETTMIYLHVQRVDLQKITSPLDVISVKK